jgi:hypothetical protein
MNALPALFVTSAHVIPPDDAEPASAAGAAASAAGAAASAAGAAVSAALLPQPASTDATIVAAITRLSTFFFIKSFPPFVL